MGGSVGRWVDFFFGDEGDEAFVYRQNKVGSLSVSFYSVGSNSKRQTNIVRRGFLVETGGEGKFRRKDVGTTPLE